MTPAELLERVLAAKRPDREIDGDVAVLFRVVPQHELDIDGNPDGPMERADDACWFGGGRNWVAPAYTASLDAAVALVERERPGWAWSVGNTATGGQAYLMAAAGIPLRGAKAAEPALALIAALLGSLT